MMKQLVRFQVQYVKMVLDLLKVALYKNLPICFKNITPEWKPSTIQNLNSLESKNQIKVRKITNIMNKGRI